ncbi:MAG TPA: hypothetical protein VHR18_13410 [Solirubrobacterales bacterium]|nr:hypothetical protein [Solirubrobacterales bacterium]
MKHRLTRSAAFGAAFSLAAAALAFFAVTYLAEGSKEGTTGGAAESTLPISVSFANGLAPGKPVALTATVNNSTTGTVKFGHLVPKIETPTVPVCGESWLELYAESGPGLADWQTAINTGLPPAGKQFTYEKGSAVDLFGGLGTEKRAEFILRFKPSTESTNQTACANVPVKVSFKLTP